MVIPVSEFTHLIDLASARLGATVLAANDEFFAEKENLLKPEPPVFAPDRYTDRGKWMDGWETRRRRTPGHDWCVIRLGLPGVIHSVTVDTSFFTGNYPSHCSIDVCGLPPGAVATADDVTWHPLLARSELAGNTANVFSFPGAHEAPHRVTHVRLIIFPDGGVARLRVLGEVLPDWTRVLAPRGEIDLAAAVHGGYVVDTSDRFYGDPRNMLMPYRAANMGDGWETKRRRGPGHDWAVVRLGIAGEIARVEVDTAHFKGNYPDRCSIQAADVSGGTDQSLVTQSMFWRTLLPEQKLEMDLQHHYQKEVADLGPITHVRFNNIPDGGISRLRLWGELV
jgi:allantoicase